MVDREKQCFLILSLLSHNLTGKLIFSQKRVNIESGIKFDCLLLLMLSNVDVDAFKLHFWCFTPGPKHSKCWNRKTLRYKPSVVHAWSNIYDACFCGMVKQSWHIFRIKTGIGSDINFILYLSSVEPTFLLTETDRYR